MPNETVMQAGQARLQSCENTVLIIEMLFNRIGDNFQVWLYLKLNER